MFGPGPRKLVQNLREDSGVIWDQDREASISRMHLNLEKIIGMLREAEVALAHWKKVSEACRHLEISEQKYH